jgi:hypothetical protein
MSLVCVLVLTGCDVQQTRSPGRDPLTRSGGAIVGIVRDTAGAPLADVEVAAPSGAPTRTDAAGNYALSSLAAAADAVITYRRPGYSTGYRRMQVRDGEVMTANAVLGSGKVITVDRIEAGATLERNGVRVMLAERSVVDAAGAPVEGAIEVTISTIDPTTADMAASPSDFKAIRAGGERVGLQTFGMVEVRLRRGDQELNLARGKPAKLEMMLPRTGMPEGQPVAMGTEIPLWWLNPATALWEEQGKGQVRASTVDPQRLAYFAEVPHFSWWNCDQAFILTCIEGYVEDCYGNPVANAQVIASGVSYRGDTFAQTDSSGFYRIWPVRTSATVRVEARGVVAGKEMLATSEPIATPANPVDEGSGDCGKVQSLAMPVPARAAQVIVTQMQAIIGVESRQMLSATAAFFEPREGAAECVGLPSTDECFLEEEFKADEGQPEPVDGGEEVSLTCENGEPIVLEKNEMEDGGVRYVNDETAMPIAAAGMDFDVQSAGSTEVDSVNVLRAVKMPEPLEMPEVMRGAPIRATRGGGAEVRWTPSRSGRGRIFVKILASNGTRISCIASDNGSMLVPADLVAKLPSGGAQLEVYRARARYFPAGDGIGIGIGHSMVAAQLLVD